MTMVGLLLLSRNMDAEIKEEFAAVRAEIRGVEATLRAEVREEGIATRRHFDVVAESLRDDIRIIAEGLIALDAKVETIRDSG
jgi:putative N-acetylmannosamine-6-phosphate epimerase